MPSSCSGTWLNPAYQCWKSVSWSLSIRVRICSSNPPRGVGSVSTESMTSHAALFRNGHRGRAIDWTAGIRGVRAWLSVDLHAGPHTRGDRTVLPRRNLTRSARRVEATRRTVAIPTVATPSTRHTRRTTGRSPCQGRRNRAPSHARALRQVGYEILWCPTRVRKSVNHKLSITPVVLPRSTTPYAQARTVEAPSPRCRPRPPQRGRTPGHYPGVPRATSPTTNVDAGHLRVRRRDLLSAGPHPWSPCTS